MNKAEYQEYCDNVASFFEREGINSLSLAPINPETGDWDSEYYSDPEREYVYPDDPYFSGQPCDCCQRPLAGNRRDCIGYNPTTEEIQGIYSVCDDCEYYCEYGQLDDMTMEP